MVSKNNVISLDQKRKEKKTQEGSESVKKAKGPITKEIVDITEKRQEIISQERRQVKRTILTEFIGAFVVIPGKGLLKVSIYDVSLDGIAFDVEGDEGCFTIGEEVAMRVYLNQKTYFPFVAKIQNVRRYDDDGLYRHGGVFERENINDEALYHFVKFIETVSASLERDGGDVMVSNLK